MSQNTQQSLKKVMQLKYWLMLNLQSQSAVVCTTAALEAADTLLRLHVCGTDIETTIQ